MEFTLLLFSLFDLVDVNSYRRKDTGDSSVPPSGSFLSYGKLAKILSRFEDHDLTFG